MNEEMAERVMTLGEVWKDEGDGYFSMDADDLAYIALPEGHPDIGEYYGKFDPEVNGGLTFGEGNVFGWDYRPYGNHGSPADDIPVVLTYFRERERSNQDCSEKEKKGGN